MATLMWTITCQRIIVDIDSNFVTYVDGVEELRIPTVPIALSIMVGSLWTRDTLGESIRMRLGIVDPDGTVLMQTEGYLSDQVAMRHRAHLQLIFLIHKPGVHFVTVEQFVGADWTIEKSIPIDVFIVSPEVAKDEPSGHSSDSDTGLATGTASVTHPT